MRKVNKLADLSNLVLVERTRNEFNSPDNYLESFDSNGDFNLFVSIRDGDSHHLQLELVLFQICEQKGLHLSFHWSEFVEQLLDYLESSLLNANVIVSQTVKDSLH